LLTKQQRLALAAEKTQKKIQDAKGFKLIDLNAQQAKSGNEGMGEAARALDSGGSGLAKPVEPRQAEKKKKEPEICACGAAEPAHKGYCTACV
jgi:hypothetical protein